MEARILVPLWRSLPQTPQAAEYVGLAIPYQHLSGEAQVASDCANAVRDFQRPFDAAMLPSRRYAGVVRDSWAQPSRRNVTVTKVKAHRTWAGMAEGEERCHAIGNDEADVAAKVAVLLHEPPPPAEVTQLEADCRRAALAIRTIAATMSTFPPMPKERMVRRPVAREGAAINGDGGHQWAFEHGFWRCVRCLKCTAKAEIPASVAHSKCEGPKESLMLSVVAGKGHSVACTGDSFRVVFCTACGAFSWRRAYGLGDICPRKATPAGKQALARIRKGHAPWQVRTVAGAVRPSIGRTAVVWRSLDHEPVWVAGDGTYSRKRGPAVREGGNPADARGGARDVLDDADADGDAAAFDDLDADQREDECHRPCGPVSKRARSAASGAVPGNSDLRACRQRQDASKGSSEGGEEAVQEALVHGDGDKIMGVAASGLGDAHADAPMCGLTRGIKRPVDSSGGCAIQRADCGWCNEDSLSSDEATCRAVRPRAHGPLYAVGGGSSSGDAMTPSDADQVASRAHDATGNSRSEIQGDDRPVHDSPAEQDDRTEVAALTYTAGDHGGGCDMEVDRPVQGQRLLRVDPRGALRGCHRLDGGQVLRESIGPHPRCRHGRDGVDRLEASSQSARHPRGPLETSETTGTVSDPVSLREGSPRDDLVVAVGSGSGTCIDRLSTLDGAPSGARGPHRCDAPPRRDLPRPHRERLPRRDPGREAHGRGGSPAATPTVGALCPPVRPRPRAEPGDHAPGDEGGGNASRPAWGQPAWLYLPHLGIGTGEELIEDVRSAKRRRPAVSVQQHPVLAPVAGGAPATGGSDLAPGASSLEANARASCHPAPIRGPSRHSHRLGAGDDCQRAVAEGDSISGLGHQLGSSRARCSAAVRAREVRTAAQRAAIQRSLDDHAERVANKRMREAGAPSAVPSAADRLAAIRERVAGRQRHLLAHPPGLAVDASTPTRAAAGPVAAVAHAAARVAEHAVVGPDADEGCQLRA